MRLIIAKKIAGLEKEWHWIMEKCSIPANLQKHETYILSNKLNNVNIYTKSV